MRSIALALVAMVSVGAASAAPADRIVLPTNVSPTHYDIAITPNAAALTFTGSVKIDIDVKQAANRIVLNAADLNFAKVSVSGASAAPAVSYDKTQETATLIFPANISAGAHVLSIDYTGKINQHAAGLFALDYDVANGKKRALFTQFENSDARRFIPSWDEPGHKATFTLTATVPADEMAVSNTPIASTDTLSGNLKRVHFAASPKMSSYLLFFGVGDFERISRKVNGVDVGVIVKRGDTARAAYALDAASHILPYYEDYFGVKFPLPKLDLIAGPGQSQFFGAMENWGAIFYFEGALLIDPKLSTESDKREIYIVIAHEMAHQWFGDLVTMAWWDDLWLNEGFASWMEVKATDHFNPEWHLWLDSQNAKEDAMRVDARGGTHPIIQPIKDVLQANEAFDTITYEKGESVIRMLEDYVGADAFRAGVRNYMKDHAYSNTVTDDLWRELDKTSTTPVSTVAHDFTLQAGVPLIRVTVTPKGLHLTQGRFTNDGTGDATTSWHVPVSVQALGASNIWHGLVTRAQPADVAESTNTAVVVNAGQAGYFRTLYAPAAFAPLAAHFAELKAADQLGLVNDTRALAYAGYEPFGDFISLAAKVTPQTDPTVLTTLAGRLEGIDSLYRELPGQAAYRKFALGVLDPVFAKVGWTAKPGESQNVALLRQALLEALGQMGDPAVIAEARRRFAGFVKDQSSLSGDMRDSVLAIAAGNADAATWEQLHTLAKTTKDSLEKRRYYRLLGTAYNRDLANEALKLAMTDEAEVTTRPSIIREVAGWYPDMAFDFAVANFEKINAMLEPDSRNQFEVGLAAGSYNRATIAKVKAYADAHIAASARQDSVKAQASIAEYATIREKRLPEIDSVLAARKH
jgi:aminopeptidase N